MILPYCGGPLDSLGMSTQRGIRARSWSPVDIYRTDTIDIPNDQAHCGKTRQRNSTPPCIFVQHFGDIKKEGRPPARRAVACGAPNEDKTQRDGLQTSPVRLRICRPEVIFL